MKAASIICLQLLLLNSWLIKTTLSQNQALTIVVLTGSGNEKNDPYTIGRIALSLINNSTTILEGYRLEVTKAVSGCEVGPPGSVSALGSLAAGGERRIRKGACYCWDDWPDMFCRCDAPGISCWEERAVSAQHPFCQVCAVGESFCLSQFVWYRRHIQPLLAVCSAAHQNEQLECRQRTV